MHWYYLTVLQTNVQKYYVPSKLAQYSNITLYTQTKTTIINKSKTKLKKSSVFYNGFQNTNYYSGKIYQ